MYKKILMVLLISFSLVKAVEVPLNSNKITMNFLNGKTYFFIPITDISYTQLQDAITNESAKIYVYRWYQQSGIIEAIFGVKILGKIEITKDDIKYLLKHTTGNWQSYDSAQELVNAINKYKDNATKNKNQFYLYPKLEAFSKLKKYSQYFIKPVGMDLTITFTLSPNNGFFPPTPLAGGN